MQNKAIINPHDMVFDSFKMHFGKGPEEEAKFNQCVFEFDQAADWRSVNVGKVKIGATASWAGKKPIHGGADAINKSSYLVVRLGSAQSAPYALRPWACNSICDICQDDPKINRRIIAAGATDIIGRRLNEDLKFLPQDKEILFLIRGEKISGVFGDFNASMTQSEQLAELHWRLSTAFSKREFLGGYLGHDETCAEYQLAPSISDESFLAASLNMENQLDIQQQVAKWEDAGLSADMLRLAVPTVEFRTGESGLAQLMLVPRIHYRSGGVVASIIVGAPLQTKHRGSDDVVWGPYCKSLDNVPNALQLGIQSLVDLAQVRVKHPYACLTHLLKAMYAYTPKAEILQTLDAFALVYPQETNEEVSAFVLFEAVNDTQQRAGKCVSLNKQRQGLDFIAKMLNPKFKWKQYDVDTPAVFSRVKEPATDEDDEKTNQMVIGE